MGLEMSIIAGVTLDSKVKRPGRKDCLLDFLSLVKNLPLIKERNKSNAKAITAPARA